MSEDGIQRRAAALFAWLNQVKADDDKSLPASAFKVAFEIGQHINGAAFEQRGVLLAFPALTTIGKAIAMSERTAREMAGRLEARGHLHIEVGHGPGHPSRYTLILKKRQEAAALDETETGSGLPLLNDEKRQPASRNAAAGFTESGSRLPTNHCEPFSNHGERTRTRATLIPDDFKLNDEAYNSALSKLGDADAVERSLERFRNHYRQVDGKAAYSRDWQAKARNWIDSDAAPTGHGRRSAHAAIARLQARASDQSTTIDGTTEEGWRQVLSRFAKHQQWTRHGEYGPPPGQPRCFAPRHLLIEFGIIEENAA